MSESIKSYVIPFIAYVVLSVLLGSFFEKNNAYFFSILVTLILLTVFWKNYSLNFKISAKDLFFTLLMGVVTYLSWILLEGKYPLLSTSEAFIASNNFELILRFIGFVLVTPLVEEIFTRGFLIRYSVDENFKKVALGKFTWFSFILTVLFFGFSHGEWLQGLIAGVLLNLLYYKTKRVETCVLGHSLVNFLLLVL